MSIIEWLLVTSVSVVATLMLGIILEHFLNKKFNKKLNKEEADIRRLRLGESAHVNDPRISMELTMRRTALERMYIKFKNRRGLGLAVTVLAVSSLLLLLIAGIFEQSFDPEVAFILAETSTVSFVTYIFYLNRRHRTILILRNSFGYALDEAPELRRRGAGDSML